MSTNGAVGVRLPDGSWRARYVHWDGDSVGDDVRAFIARDGRDKVVQVLTEEHFGWSSLDSRPGKADGTLRPYDDPARFVAVKGYGVAYVNHTEQPDEWITPDDGDDWIEYVHIIEPDGSVTTLEV